MKASMNTGRHRQPAMQFAVIIQASVWVQRQANSRNKRRIISSLGLSSVIIAEQKSISLVERRFGLIPHLKPIGPLVIEKVISNLVANSGNCADFVDSSDL
jgi:hypothetical protein